MGIFYERHDVYHHVYHPLAFLSCLGYFFPTPIYFQILPGLLELRGGACGTGTE